MSITPVGSYFPFTGDSFAPLNYGIRSGQFSAVQGLGAASQFAIMPAYGINSMSVLFQGAAFVATAVRPNACPKWP